MAGDLTITRAGAADVPALLDLYRHLNPDDPPLALDSARDIFERFGADPNSAILCGFCRDVMVASCTVIVIPNLTRGGKPYALIENVVTHADHRKRGYGTAILHAAAEMAWAQDCYKVMLMTGSTRPSTLKFYQDAGFEQNKTGFQMRRG